MLKTNMGRRIPIGDDINDFSLIHYSSVLSLPLQMAWMAATVATITALCIRRKSKQPRQSSSSPPHLKVKANQATAGNSNDFDKSSPVESDQDQVRVTQQQEVNKEQPLPPPPASMKTMKETSSFNILRRTMSMQRVEKSLSMRISRSLSMRNQEQHDHQGNKKKRNLKADQDSVWSKAIILGEKCRPDDEDDTVIYDNKGNKISPYHKKTHSHLPSLSRINSHIDTHAIATSSGLHDNEDKRNVTKDEGLLLV